MPSAPALGSISAIVAYLFWGLSPLYWKSLQHVPSLDLLIYRTSFGLPLLLAFILYQRKMPELRQAYATLKTSPSLWLSTIIIGFNWFLYVWAVNNNFITQASLGYFILPLVTILLGLVVLRESISTLKKIALIIAAAGVLYMTLQLRSVPVVALSLALSFALYSLIRKQIKVNALCGLFVELSLMTGPFLLYILWQIFTTNPFATYDTLTLTLIGLSGAMTCTPLFCYTFASRQLPFTHLSFYQYIGPSLQILLATLVYGEAFTVTHAVSFGLIWIALGILSMAMLNQAVRRRLRGQ